VRVSEWTLTLDGERVEPLEPDVLVAPEIASRFRLVAGETSTPVPPLDELGIYGDLPEVPDATLSIHYEVRATPIGVIRVELDLVDGHMVSATSVVDFSTTEGPMVFVSIDWDRHLEWRSGGCSVLEALEGAHLEARWQVMLLAHGLLQQEQWKTAMRTLTRVRP
jgi:hypothetical protein